MIKHFVPTDPKEEILLFDLFIVQYRKKVCSDCTDMQKERRNAIVGVTDGKCYCSNLNKSCNKRLINIIGNGSEKIKEFKEKDLINPNPNITDCIIKDAFMFY